MHREVESEPFTWSHFVRRSGRNGERWVDEFRRHRAVWETCDRALELLRRECPEQGEELLGRAHALLAGLGGLEPSVRSVLDRVYLGVLGYASYRRGALDEADALMVRAHAALAAAVEVRPFLVPLAYHGHEFRLHRARIARSRRRWEEMRDHLLAARGMVEGSVPLCSCSDGSPVMLESLQAFYRSLAPLTDAERHACGMVLDPQGALSGFDRYADALWLVPGFVVQYP
jgi:hypothetical protein